MPPMKYIDRRRLKKHVVYDPTTGQFSVKLATPRMPVGHIFSSKYPDSYIHISVGPERFAAHRAAWVYMTGKQPDVINHINGIPHDNRWHNLRDVTHQENCRNKSSYRLAFPESK